MDRIHSESHQERLANDIKQSATRWPELPSAVEPKKSETNRLRASRSAPGWVKPRTNMRRISSSDCATMVAPLEATGQKWSKRICRLKPSHGARSLPGGSKSRLITGLSFKMNSKVTVEAALMLIAAW